MTQNITGSQMDYFYDAFLVLFWRLIYMNGPCMENSCIKTREKYVLSYK